VASFVQPPGLFLPFSPSSVIAATVMFTALSLAFLLATFPVAWSVPTWNTQVPFSPSFPYGSEPVRGVNLGGWLVLEVCYKSFFTPRNTYSFSALP
jgi:hypothetical protein